MCLTNRLVRSHSLKETICKSSREATFFFQFSVLRPPPHLNGLIYILFYHGSYQAFDWCCCTFVWFRYCPSPPWQRCWRRSCCFCPQWHPHYWHCWTRQVSSSSLVLIWNPQTTTLIVKLPLRLLLLPLPPATALVDTAQVAMVRAARAVTAEVRVAAASLPPLPPTAAILDAVIPLPLPWCLKWLRNRWWCPSQLPPWRCRPPWPTLCHPTALVDTTGKTLVTTTVSNVSDSRLFLFPCIDVLYDRMHCFIRCTPCNLHSFYCYLW